MCFQLSPRIRLLSLVYQVDVQRTGLRVGKSDTLNFLSESFELTWRDPQGSLSFHCNKVYPGVFDCPIATNEIVKRGSLYPPILLNLISFTSRFVAFAVESRRANRMEALIRLFTDSTFSTASV